MAVENRAQETTSAQEEQTPHIVNLLEKRHDEIISLWIKDRLESGEFRDELIPKKELRRQSQQIVDMLSSSIRIRTTASLNLRPSTSCAPSSTRSLTREPSRATRRSKTRPTFFLCATP